MQVYDDFGKAGYSLTDYNEKWMTPNGLGEMAVEDTRSFSGGRFHLSAAPFQTGADVGVDGGEHLPDPGDTEHEQDHHDNDADRPGHELSPICRTRLVALFGHAGTYPSVVAGN